MILLMLAYGWGVSFRGFDAQRNPGAKATGTGREYAEKPENTLQWNGENSRFPSGRERPSVSKPIDIPEESRRAMNWHG
jgi:hypothetical protein